MRFLNEFILFIIPYNLYFVYFQEQSESESVSDSSSLSGNDEENGTDDLENNQVKFEYL